MQRNDAMSVVDSQDRLTATAESFWAELRAVTDGAKVQ
jgi:hypothetical protein